MALIKGIIFDFDGTLVDSNKIHVKAYTLALKPYKIKVPDQVFIDNFGVPGRIILKENTNLTDEQIDDVLNRNREYCEKAVTQHGFPIESQDTIVKLKGMGFKVSIVSGGFESYIMTVVPKGLVGIILGAESNITPKPAPDMLFKAAEMMGLKPEECLFVGDSHIDAQAAKAAGVKFVGIKSALAWADLKEEMKGMDSKAISHISEILSILGEYPKEL